MGLKFPPSTTFDSFIRIVIIVSVFYIGASEQQQIPCKIEIVRYGRAVAPHYDNNSSLTTTSCQSLSNSSLTTTTTIGELLAAIPEPQFVKKLSIHRFSSSRNNDLISFKTPTNLTQSHLRPFRNLAVFQLSHSPSVTHLSDELFVHNRRLRLVKLIENPRLTEYRWQTFRRFPQSARLFINSSTTSHEGCEKSSSCASNWLRDRTLKQPRLHQAVVIKNSQNDTAATAPRVLERRISDWRALSLPNPKLLTVNISPMTKCEPPEVSRRKSSCPTKPIVSLNATAYTANIGDDIYVNCTIESFTTVDFDRPVVNPANLLSVLSTFDPANTESKLRSWVSQRNDDSKSSTSKITVSARISRVDWENVGWIQCQSGNSEQVRVASAAMPINSKPRFVEATEMRKTYATADQRMSFVFIGYPMDRIRNVTVWHGESEIDFQMTPGNHGVGKLALVSPTEGGGGNSALISTARLSQPSLPVRLILGEGRGYFERVVHLRIITKGMNRKVYAGNYTMEICNQHGCENGTHTVLPTAAAAAAEGRKGIFRSTRLPSRMPIAETRRSNRRQNFNHSKIKPFHWVLLCAFLVFTVLITLAVLSVQLWHKRKKVRVKESILELSQPTECIPLQANFSYMTSAAAFMPTHLRTIPNEHLMLEKEIGEGAFGKVFLGKAPKLILNCPIGRPPKRLSVRDIKNYEPVAVKSLKDFSANQAAKFEQEAELLGKLDHENIVKFIGISHNFTDLLLIFEFMDLGDLKMFLRLRGPDAILLSSSPKKDNLSKFQLMLISYQICCGLRYLSDRRVVHRDLAARNCLVSSMEHPFIVKLSDFGMSRDVYSSDYYKVLQKDAALPVRWLPPESISFGTFTLESDVWSFGILLWEVWSFGKIPYTHLSNCEVVNNVVERGSAAKISTETDPPLPIPNAECPVRLYEAVMTECWHTVPKQRISVPSIQKHLRSLLDQEREWSNKAGKTSSDEN